MTWDELKKSAEADIKDRFNYAFAQRGANGAGIAPCDIERIIQEVTDGQVPVYYSDILEVAGSNLDLVKVRPELGCADDATPHDMIRANIYEALLPEVQSKAQALAEYLNMDNIDKAYKLYEEGGEAAVHEAIKRGEVRADGYVYCEPCDTAVPYDDQTCGEPLCLICGQEVDLNRVPVATEA